MDGTVVLVSLVFSLAAGLFVGSFPIAGISGIGLSEALPEDSRTGTTGKKSRSVRQLLVAAKIGFAFALLVGAGLLLASFRLLSQVDPGFNSHGVVTASIALPRSRYTKPELLRDFMNRALPAVRAIPGVSIAGATDAIPLGSNHDDSVILAEGYQMKPGESLISPLNISVTPGYFEALGIHMVRGRSFDDRDNENAPRVVIVDERLAQHFWPDRDPLGRRMDMPNDSKDLLKIDEHTVWLTVVGVARALRYENLDGSGAPVGAYYFPNSQQPAGGFTFALTTAADSGAVIRAPPTGISPLEPHLAAFAFPPTSQRRQ